MSIQQKKLTRALVASALVGGLVVGIPTGLTYLANDYNSKYEDLKEHTDTLNQRVSEQNKVIEIQQQQLNTLNDENKNLKEQLKQEQARQLEVIVTAYDLSEQSCAKGLDAPDYGITANGTNLSGHTIWSARAIAVDPKVIPLGSKVKIKFKDPELQKYNGIYTAVDTGSAIKNNKIDLFMGDFKSASPSKEALDFGVKKASLKVL